MRALIYFVAVFFACSFDDANYDDDQSMCAVQIVEPMHWEAVPSPSELVIAIQVLGCVDLLESNCNVSLTSFHDHFFSCAAIFGVIYLDYQKVAEFRDQMDHSIRIAAGLSTGHHTIHVYLADDSGAPLGIRDAIMIRVVNESMLDIFWERIRMISSPHRR